MHKQMHSLMQESSKNITLQLPHEVDSLPRFFSLPFIFFKQALRLIDSRRRYWIAFTSNY